MKMTTGMLWYDTDRTLDLAARLERAANHYRSKYGAQPNLCFLHPSATGADTPSRVGSIELRTDRAVLPGHLWLGVAASSG
jgi:hypothetical protein